MKTKKTKIPLISVAIAMIILCGGDWGFSQESTGIPETKVVFVTSTLERIISEPQQVLEREDNFWTEEKVQVLAQGWIDEVRVKNARDKWRRNISELAGLTPEERKKHHLVEMTDYIKSKESTFADKATPLLVSFVPETDRKLDLPVYFTAYIPPRAFASSEGIVIDVASSYWNDNPDNILNCLVHELFHICYSWFRAGRTEVPVYNEFHYKMMEFLQNEGLATYVGYNALPIFPAPDEKDYALLESPEEVTRLINEVNGLFAKVNTVSPKELQQAHWKTGVKGRGYYIAGAHMAQVIEKELGRDRLQQTIVEGPRSFIELYNSIAPEDSQIHYSAN